MENENTNENQNEKILSSFDKMIIKELVTEKIRTVYDPEIPVNVYELGMVYDIEVKDNGFVNITMTLTSPACPAAQTIPIEVRQKAEEVKGVASANVNIVWEPRWEPSMMSEEARLTLGF